MPMIDQVATAMQDVLLNQAQRLARETGFVQRESKLDGARFVQTLVGTYLADPSATLDQLTQTAAALGVTITAPGLDQRFTEAAATFLQQVLAAAVTTVLATDPWDLPVLRQFSGIFVDDSTVIALPAPLRQLWRGCGNAQNQGAAALKLMVRLDLATGLLAGLTLHDGRTSDRTAAAPLTTLPAGALYLADLGFFTLARFQEIAEQGSFFLSRLPVRTVVFTADGRRWDDLRALLATQGETVDQEVQVGVTRRVAARLLAVRVPQEVADQRRRRIRAEARRRGRTPGARQLALAAWTLFITNAPATMLPLSAVLVVARVRWQIELLFKRWKSHGCIDESRSGKPWRVIGDVYAKLLAMLIQHWISLISLWDYPDRSLAKAAQTVQKYALQLLGRVWDRPHLHATLADLARVLAAGCRMTTRRKKPNTYQWLLAVSEIP